MKSCLSAFFKTEKRRMYEVWQPILNSPDEEKPPVKYNFELSETKEVSYQALEKLSF